MASRKVVPTEAGDQTKERILSAAEHLFADNGFEGVSMRDIGRDAQVPFALITYHFETKLGVYRAVFRRRAQFITTMRLDRLRSIAIAGDTRADIHNIARALVEPLTDLRKLEGGLDFRRLIAREVCDPAEAERAVVAEYLDSVALAAIGLLRKAAPNASYKQVCWAFYLASGSLAINNINTGRLERLSSGKCQSKNADEMRENLISFLTNAWSGLLDPVRGGSTSRSRSST